MKSLNTLIKLEKRKIDELRRMQAALEAKRQRLKDRADAMERETQQEMALAGEHPEMGAFFGDFAQRMRRSRELIAVDIQKVDAEIATFVEQIAERFTELKKFEIIKAQREKKMREEEKRKEDKFLDEVGEQGFARRKNSDTSA